MHSSEPVVLDAPWPKEQVVSVCPQVDGDSLDIQRGVIDNMHSVVHFPRPCSADEEVDLDSDCNALSRAETDMEVHLAVLEAMSEREEVWDPDTPGGSWSTVYVDDIYAATCESSRSAKLECQASESNAGHSQMYDCELMIPLAHSSRLRGNMKVRESDDGGFDSDSSKSVTSCRGRDVMDRLRHEFDLVDEGAKGFVSQEMLLRHITRLVEQSGKISVKSSNLLSEVARCRFLEMNLSLSWSRITVNEWVHFMMLRRTAPSHMAARFLNEKLRGRLISDRKVLQRMLAAFDKRMIDERITESSWVYAFQEVCITDVDPHQCVHRALQADLGMPGCLDYFEFVSFALGARPATVELAMYDLSSGIAQWVPRMLLDGHRFEGIWHTGVRVFGYEYWYGGVIKGTLPESIPFGKPARVIHLGQTLRSQRELVQFMVSEMVHLYSRSNYDWLNHNCNTFSNDVVKFLLQGKQIPSEVLLQPKWVQDVSFSRLLTPLLNRWLGGFGSDESATLSSQQWINNLIEEWRRRLRVDDIVLHRSRFEDRPSLVRITSIDSAEGLGRQADLCFFGTSGARWDEGLPAWRNEGVIWTWSEVHKPAVSMREIFPCINRDDFICMVLRVSMTLDSSVSQVLRRPSECVLGPACPKGHDLVPSCHSWREKLLDCAICGEQKKDQHSCALCAHCVCGDCLKRGAKFRGGGVFADLLTPELAEDLLAHPRWLRFVSNTYFWKADYNRDGYLDAQEIAWACERLCAEIGLGTVSTNELQSLLVLDVTQLSIAEFEGFFKSLLSRAMPCEELPPYIPFSRGRILSI